MRDYLDSRDVTPIWDTDLPAWANDVISMIVAAQSWPEGNENLAFDAQHAFTDLLNVVDDAIKALLPAGDRVSSGEPWAAPAVAAFQQNQLNHLYTPGAGLSGVQMNLRAYEMQAGNFGFNTEFGKISINIAVLVLLIQVFISLLLAFFTGDASAADVGPDVAATKTTIAGILKRVATAVADKFGAAGLRDLTAAGVKVAATESAARAGGQAAARAAGNELSRGVLNVVVAQGLAAIVGANLWELRHDPNAQLELELYLNRPGFHAVFSLAGHRLVSRSGERSRPARTPRVWCC